MIRCWEVTPTATSPYKIVIVDDILCEPDHPLLWGGRVPGRRFVIVDEGVPPAWRHRLRNYLTRHGVVSHQLVLPGGEQCKELDTTAHILREFEQFMLERRDEPVIAIGGGAVLDVASFAASIYRRGVPLVRVPTTVLSYVDASIGIKTGINFSGVKNLVGTFAPPARVLLDSTFFASLPPREIASGLGEILKLGLGCDFTLFRCLEELQTPFTSIDLSPVLERAIDVMIRELTPNLYETDLRRSVDLGHTFSQIFEMNLGTDVFRHGEAVALDLNLSAAIAHLRGLLDGRATVRVARVTEKLGLPVSLADVAPALLWMSVLERTRHRGGRQRVPLPRRIGDCTFIDDLTQEEITAAVAAVEGVAKALSGASPW